MHLIKHYQEAINKGLNSISYPEHPEKLYDPIRYFIKLGGKRIRPILTLLAAEMYDCPIEKSLNAALAIELFHNFTLMHDDIMDKASLRRGKSTVHEKWNPSIAILSGDTMLISAYQLLAQNDAAVLPQLLKVFNKAAIEVCQGQQYDMEFESQKSVSIDDYTKMIRLKTAVLLGASLKIGGLIGGAPKEDLDKLYQFGEYIGIAFQIQDDYLDAFGEEEEFGKKIGGDIASNKKTFPLLSAINLSNPAELSELNYWLNHKSPNTINKVESVLNLYKKLNIDNITAEAVQKYTQKAYEQLNKVDIHRDKKDLLLRLTNSLMERIK